MQSLFNKETKDEIVSRINNLTSNTSPQWGKMDVSQMLWHCQYPLSVAIKNKNKGNGKLLMKLFKKSVYNDKPFRKNLPTAKFLKNIASKNFNEEKGKILDMIEEVHSLKDRTNWNPHPFFGEFTSEQWGKLEYKHLDHHLKQFGV